MARVAGPVRSPCCVTAQVLPMDESVQMQMALIPGAADATIDGRLFALGAALLFFVLTSRFLHTPKV